MCRDRELAYESHQRLNHENKIWNKGYYAGIIVGASGCILVQIIIFLIINN